MIKKLLQLINKLKFWKYFMKENKIIETNHSYHCNSFENNIRTYENANLSVFTDMIKSRDFDIFYPFRYDIKKTYKGTYNFHYYEVLQRNGTIYEHIVKDINESNLELIYSVVDYCKSHIKQMWDF